jgi:hypothetical protein
MRWITSDQSHFTRIFIYVPLGLCSPHSLPQACCAAGLAAEG